MKSYKQWSANDRHVSYEKTKKAIREGVIPPATVCQCCGQDEGKIMYHNEDYSDPIKYLIPLCWTCHMMLHSKYRTPKSYTKFFKDVKEGMMPKATYGHNWKNLDIYIIESERK